MSTILKWFTRAAEFIVAGLLAAMFVVFLLQVFSRYVLLTPFGWTLELILIFWVWIVFFGCAFVVREKDHVTFDILYLAAPRRTRQIMAIAAAAAVVIGMIYTYLPTWDYIDWMRRRGTTTVKNPFTGTKIPMRTILIVYMIFMTALIGRYTWRIIDIIRNGPPDEDHELPGHDPEPPAIRHGEDVV
jgi:C4-dicarboxylate transporter DctQ subunit